MQTGYAPVLARLTLSPCCHLILLLMGEKISAKHSEISFYVYLNLSVSTYLQYCKYVSLHVCMPTLLFGGVSKSMLKLNEAIIDIKEG